MKLEDALGETPLVAILRGVRPEEILAIADALHAAGIRVVEVPLNSPDPLESISRLKAYEARLVHGAGTVLRPGAVDAVAQAGGRLVVSPNTDAGVIRRAVERGLAPMPGFASATEAFAAIEAGAKYLKLFPASTYGPGHLKALSAVLPPEAVVQPVGGIGPKDMAVWWEAGARGFGLGSDLYKPGFTAEQVHARAVKAVAAVRLLR
ncbi:MAG TPA: 2-dehydro-3-deoxy-6-phosphogalactonate aldolase [Caulobacteraceae bacterium]|jgi:2-dehydro-3-deoxyphosphogalactonate aldolase|nr:2-dehydro-3-deoxy-6-phosphogalactonate aldolase [Caulobacteraceae bacterium]